MNAIFTIVAKNYLALAFTLADSLKKVKAESDFFIYVTDDCNGVSDELRSNYSIRMLDTNIVPDSLSMSFKYSVTEYSTAVKPYIFTSLFNKEGYDKIIYIDPDIYFYSSPTAIFDELTTHNCLLTPHIIDTEVNYTGNVNETEFLFAGIYNLGFIGLKKSRQTTKLLDWWANRLQSLCYGDRLESLHVDQKWMDLGAVLFSEDVHSFKHPGLNIAYWNVHERIISKSSTGISVQKKNEVANLYDLVFMHFSGVNPLNIYINKQSRNIDIRDYPVWEDLIKEYASLVLANHHKDLIKLGYSFSKFDNGDSITPLHRRLYRRLVDMNKIDTSFDPFKITGNRFYSLLKESNLLVGKERGSIEINDMSQTSATGKLRMILRLLKIIKKIIGIKRYTTLIRFFQKITISENQIFLIKGYEEEFIQSYSKKYF